VKAIVTEQEKSTAQPE